MKYTHILMVDIHLDIRYHIHVVGDTVNTPTFCFTTAVTPPEHGITDKVYKEE